MAASLLAVEGPSVIRKIETGLTWTAKAATVAQAAYKLGRTLAPYASRDLALL